VTLGRALEQSPLLARTVRVEPRAATRSELERGHAAAFLDSLEAEVRGHAGWLDADTYFCEASWETALLAAGSAIELAERVAEGSLTSGFAAVRPPGHHATTSRAMGFCLLNNVAVAAAALKARGLRVAVVDWDVHHGNGTEEIIERLGDILYCSLHESPQYPGTGAATVVGRDQRLVNVPLAAGTGDQDYLAAYRARVAPRLEAFAPEVILVSAGFDAHREDPIAGLYLSEAAYVELTRHLLTVTPKLVLILEGGYAPEALARSALAVLEVLVEAAEGRAAARGEALVASSTSSRFEGPRGLPGSVPGGAA
jgi:acetoin utilization deacetylase AcuC-like enzyme